MRPSIRLEDTVDITYGRLVARNLPIRHVLQLSGSMKLETAQSLIRALPNASVVLLDPSTTVDLAVAIASAMPLQGLLMLEPGVSVEVARGIAKTLPTDRAVGIDSQTPFSIAEAIVSSLSKGTVLLDPDLSEENLITLVEKLNPNAELYLSAKTPCEKADLMIKHLPQGCSLLLSEHINLETAIRVASLIKTGRGIRISEEFSWGFSKILSIAKSLPEGCWLALPNTLLPKQITALREEPSIQCLINTSETAESPSVYAARLTQFGLLSKSGSSVQLASNSNLCHPTL
ncbi:hypothetical protein [Legionella impletisoli]|uniref:Uncharacterized protein n=1 Tax=Legionella impletisoli TaxID=343510 RepID=A0A917NCH4_9GAMM|nr:hypothetical protein [Legionella impletisoli]GGI83973.1 hypothetical protein GCM10007966_10770 [Legionella impletisoli]